MARLTVSAEVKKTNIIELCKWYMETDMSKLQGMRGKQTKDLSLDDCIRLVKVEKKFPASLPKKIAGLTGMDSFGATLQECETAISNYIKTHK